MSYLALKAELHAWNHIAVLSFALCHSVLDPIISEFLNVCI